MSSISKRQKQIKRLKARQLNDRISNLPNGLITKILSCLPTKDAVMTSALSTKWKRSWTSVTNIDIDDKLIDYNSEKNDKPSIEDFKSFVYRLLLLRDRSCLQRLRIRFIHEYDESLVNAWISVVLLCNIQEIDVSVRIKNPGYLPCDIFLCRTLVVLKLHAKGSVNMPTSVCLPRVRTIHLRKVKLCHDEAFISLLSGCPLLEELRLSQCVGDDVRVINIVAPVLRSLIVMFLPYDKRNMEPKYQIVLDTPALEYLNFSDYVAEGYVMKNTNCVIKAKIKIEDSNVYQYDDRDEQLTRSKPLADLFKGISQVHSLFLSDESMEAIDSVDILDAVLPIFSNLTELKLNSTMNVGWGLLMKFIENSPCLENLYLCPGRIEDFGYYDYFTNHVVPSCLVSHLKELQIVEVDRYEMSMEMIEYFLKNAKVLKKLTLHYKSSEDTEKNTEFYKTLVKFPRASAACKVVVL